MKADDDKVLDNESINDSSHCSESSSESESSRGEESYATNDSKTVDSNVESQCKGPSCVPPESSFISKIERGVDHVNHMFDRWVGFSAPSIDSIESYHTDNSSILSNSYEKNKMNESGKKTSIPTNKLADITESPKRNQVSDSTPNPKNARKERSNENSTNRGGLNKVHELIEKCDWINLENVMGTSAGRAMVSISHPNAGGDYPLHLICNYTLTTPGQRKTISFEDQDKEEKGSKDEKGGEKGLYEYKELKSSEDGNEDISICTDKNSVLEGDRDKMPPASLVISILHACPDIAKMKGFSGRIPLH